MIFIYKSQKEIVRYTRIIEYKTNDLLTMVYIFCRRAKINFKLLYTDNSSLNRIKLIF